MPYRVGHGNAGLTGPEIKLITVPDPGAEAATIYTVPPGKISRFSFVRALAVASATAGSRDTFLSIRDPLGFVLFKTQFGSLTASDLAQIQGLGSSVPTDLLTQNSIGTARSIPEGPWPEGVFLRISISPFQAGDEVKDVRVLVEEWEGV